MAKRRERRAREQGKPRPKPRVYGKRKPGEPLPKMRIGVVERMEVRRLKALELRIDRHSYRAIAQKNQCSVDTAWEDVQIELGNVLERKAKAAENLLELELEGLDRLQAAHMNAALKRDYQSSLVVLKCHELRSRLLNLFPHGQQQGLPVLPVVDVGASATLTARLDDTRRRLAAATVTAMPGEPAPTILHSHDGRPTPSLAPIDWSAYEAAGTAATETTACRAPSSGS